MEGKEREERGIGGEGKMNLFGLSVRKRGEGVSNVVEDGVRGGGREWWAGGGGKGRGGENNCCARTARIEELVEAETSTAEKEDRFLPRLIFHHNLRRSDEGRNFEFCKKSIS